MNSITFVLFALALTGTLALPHKPKATPAQFHEAALVAANGIWPALGQAGADIEALLAGQDDLLAAVITVLDAALAEAAEIFVPAFEALETATTDEEAETIVVNTISSLIMSGLSTEYKVEDAIIAASQETQDQVQVIVGALVKTIKDQLKPLWVLTEESRRH